MADTSAIYQHTSLSLKSPNKLSADVNSQTLHDGHTPA